MMAKQPEIHNHNRFSLLAENRQTKRLKRGLDITNEMFPELPQTSQEDPKYIIISPENSEKNFSNFSCFKIHRSLKLISKEIISITEIKDNNLLLLVKNQTTAYKFLKVKELHGLCKIKCSLHKSLNFCKGTIFAPYLTNVTEEEIIKELKEAGVVGAYKFQKYTEGTKKPNGVILLTFDRYHIPQKINISWHTVKIREYFPNPMRCKKCQLLGHTINRCSVKDPVCVNCSLSSHESTTKCTRTMCANCSGDHPSSSPT